MYVRTYIICTKSFLFNPFISPLQVCAHRYTIINDLGTEDEVRLPIGRCFYTVNRDLIDFQVIDPCPVGNDNFGLSSGGICQVGTSSVITVSLGQYTTTVYIQSVVQNLGNGTECLSCWHESIPCQTTANSYAWVVQGKRNRWWPKPLYSSIVRVYTIQPEESTNPFSWTLGVWTIEVKYTIVAKAKSKCGSAWSEVVKVG